MRIPMLGGCAKMHCSRCGLRLLNLSPLYRAKVVNLVVYRSTLLCSTSWAYGRDALPYNFTLPCHSQAVMRGGTLDLTICHCVVNCHTGNLRMKLKELLQKVQNVSPLPWKVVGDKRKQMSAVMDARNGNGILFGSLICQVSPGTW
jgi:hypothetical protein